MKRMTFEEFAGVEFLTSKYAKSQYNKYKKLSDEQLQKIKDLIPHIGENITYMRGKKPVEMKIMHIPTKIGERCKEDKYLSYPFSIRLNYINPPKYGIREWDGFWTMNIDKIITNF